LTPPKHNMDSDPPVTITGDMPERTMAKACAMAWLDEAQAVALYRRAVSGGDVASISKLVPHYATGAYG